MVVKDKPCVVCGENQTKTDLLVNGYPLLKCFKCDFVFAGVDTSEILRVNSAYDVEYCSSGAFAKNNLREEWFDFLAKKILNLYKKQHKTDNKLKILDVGCGEGILLGKFQKMGHDVYGCDLSTAGEEMSIKKGYKFLGKDLSLIENQYKNYFDIVVSTSVLEHIEFPLEFLKRLENLLKIEGLLYINGVPNYKSVSSRFHIKDMKYDSPPGHVNYFTPYTAEKVIAKTGQKSSFVYTYGLPNVFRIFNFFIGSTDKIPRKKTFNEKSRNFPRLFKIAVRLNYYFGKVFYNLGEKIEFYYFKSL